MVLNITLKTLDSQNYQFEAQDGWTVQEFKDHIKDIINVAPNEQRLIFCGRVLQDDKKLIEYDCNGKVVHLVTRPPPSMNNNSTNSVDSSSGRSSTNPRQTVRRSETIQLSDVIIPPPGTLFARRSVPFHRNRPREPTSSSSPIPAPRAEAGLGATGPAFANPSSFANSRGENQSENPQQGSHTENQSQQPTNANSTATTGRPDGAITARFPVPYDYFLFCLSPWASTTGNASNRQTISPNVINATIQIGTINPDDSVYRNVSTATDSQANNLNSANQSSNGENRSSNIVLDSGLTEVVSNIVGSIFRTPTSPQQTTTGTPNTENQQESQDPILNMIPELALNAVSQILGGVLGMPANQQQSNVSSNEQNSRNNQQSSTSSNLVVMDIDIDESSSSTQPESQSHAVTQSGPTTTTPSTFPQTSNNSSSAQRLNPPQAGHSRNSGSIRYTKQLAEVMRNHSDWVPIIEDDINIMNRQQRQQENSLIRNSQPFFSDAYLSSIPRKRRRLLAASPDRVFILHPSPAQAITNLLRRAITTSNITNSESLDRILLTISSDLELQSAYEDYIKSAIEARLKTDHDYSPQKFLNSSKYFK